MQLQLRCCKNLHTGKHILGACESVFISIWVIETLNRLGWQRPLRSLSWAITQHCQGHHKTMSRRTTSFKYLQAWWLNHFPGQPVPVLDNSFCKGIFPNIQNKPLLVQHEVISSCPITWEERLTSTSWQPSVRWLWRAIRSPLSPLFSRQNSS